MLAARASADAAAPRCAARTPPRSRSSGWGVRRAGRRRALRRPGRRTSSSRSGTGTRPGSPPPAGTGRSPPPTAERTETVAGAEQAASAALAARAAEDLERLGDPTEDARLALGAIGSAFDRGELDVTTAVLLRGEVLDGWAGAVEAERTAAELTLFHLLATEDPALLEVTP